MEQASAPNLATSLMTIHMVITRGVEVSAANASTFATHGFPDARTRNGFLNYVRALSAVIHGHHLAEDKVLFPALRPVVPEAPYEKLVADHRQMVTVLAEMAAQVLLCAAEGGMAGDRHQREAMQSLRRALGHLLALWRPHYQAEEKHFSVEVLGWLLPPEEHVSLMGRMAAFARQHAKPEPLVVPFMLYNLPEPARGVFAATLPPEVADHLVPVVWLTEWASMKPFLLD